MAPINLPDGTEVSEIVLPDGSTASKVLAPDGSTVFGAIPDSVVDNFESEIYGTSGTLSDFYSGATSGYSIVNASLEGDKGVQDSGTYPENIYSVPGDGLPNYPDPDNGDNVEAIIQDLSNRPYILFCVEDAANPGAYAAGAKDGLLRLYRIDDLTDASNTETLLNDVSNNNIGGSTDYWIVVDTPTSTDGSMTATLYNFNSDLSRGSEVESVTTTDTNYGGNRGLGWYVRGSASVRDLYRIV